MRLCTFLTTLLLVLADNAINPESSNKDVSPTDIKPSDVAIEQLRLTKQARNDPDNQWKNITGKQMAEVVGSGQPELELPKTDPIELE